MRFKFISLITLMGLLVITGCANTVQDGIRFNKTQWDSVDDFHTHPCREMMLADLIKQHRIKQLTYRQLIDSLGQPDNWGDAKDSIYYEIITNFGYLDPKSGKYLAIGFNKDSIVTGFKVVEWKNRHANE